MTTCWLRGNFYFLSVFFLSSLATLDTLNAITWKAEQDVAEYSSYTSVAPVRFSLPSDLKEAKWSFRATKYPEGDYCADQYIAIYLQFGSLPVINPLNESFPEKFLLRLDNMKELKVNSNNISVTHSQPFPQAGDWYAVAVGAKRNTAIRQKGLTVPCLYKFSSSLEVEAVPPHQHVRVNEAVSLNLSSCCGDELWVGWTVPMTALSVETTVDIRACSQAACCLQLAAYDHRSKEMLLSNCSREEGGSVATCSLHFSGPLVGVDQFVHVRLLTGANATASLALHVKTEDCTLVLDSNSDEHVTDANGSKSCTLERMLDRYQSSSSFNTVFVHLFNNTVRRTELSVSNTSATVVPFEVVRIVDTGGTLNVGISFEKTNVTGEQTVRVCGLLTHARFPVTLATSPDICSNTSNGLQINSSSNGHGETVLAKLYVPYPQEGVWLLSLLVQCVDNHNESWPVKERCEHGTVNVRVSVEISDCVDGGCSGRGDCQTNIRGSDFIVFDTCSCTAGWKGFDCSEGNDALTDDSQLIEVLLLTLSNLFFLPAIGLATYRKHYLEALVYLYNMFFSTFYHACDGDRISKYTFCLTQYSVLAVCDFLASYCSLWVTLVAVAQIPIDFNAAVHMAGVLALVVGVLLDRHSLWVMVIPAAVGFLLVVLSWCLRCCNTRRCFPSKLQYLWMVPGVVFAVGGAIMYSFCETEQNYKYVHSAWHACLSLSIIFLLPPKHKKKLVTSVNFEDTESTEGLVLGPNSYSRRMNFEL